MWETYETLNCKESTLDMARSGRTSSDSYVQTVMGLTALETETARDTERQRGRKKANKNNHKATQSTWGKWKSAKS